MKKCGSCGTMNYKITDTCKSCGVALNVELPKGVSDILEFDTLEETMDFLKSKPGLVMFYDHEHQSPAFKYV